MKNEASEELWIQNTLSEVKLREVPKAYAENFEREVYFKLNARESKPSFPLMAVGVLTLAFFLLFWMIRAVFLAPPHSEVVPKIQQMISQAPETSGFRDVPVPHGASLRNFIRHSERSEESSYSEILRQKTPQDDSSGLWEKVSEDLLILEMLGEDGEFMEELGTMDSDLQIIAQPAFNQTAL